jgi:hypothetical protein
MNREFAAYVRRRWWVLGAEALVALAVVLLVSAARDETTYAHTSHFVLHPDSRSSVADVNNAVGVSEQDGPLVQTVRRVVSSEELLRRAADAAGVHDLSQLHSSASVTPGTAYFDAVVRAPSPAVAASVGRAFDRVVPQYVERSYRGFAFDALGSDESTHSTFPPGIEVVVLALVLGAAAALAELFVVFGARSRATTAEAAPPPAPAVTPARAEPMHGNGNGNGNGNGQGAPDLPVPAKGRRGRKRAARVQAPAAP